jgi:hypothetical protein
MVCYNLLHTVAIQGMVRNNLLQSVARTALCNQKIYMYYVASQFVLRYVTISYTLHTVPHHPLQLVNFYDNQRVLNPDIQGIAQHALYTLFSHVVGKK